MKKTIITLASLATLAVSANAQTSAGTQDTTITWTDLRWNSLIGGTYDTLTSGYGNIGTFDLGNIDSSLSGITATINLSTNDSTGSSSVFLGSASGSYRSGHSRIDIAFSSPVDIRREQFNTVAFSTGETETFTAAGGIDYLEWETGVNGSLVNGVGTISAGSTPASSEVYAEAYATTGFSLEWDDSINPSTQNFRLEIAASSVPEPSSTALLGLGGLALVLRRKK